MILKKTEISNYIDFPLRKHKSDIPVLTKYFIEHYACKRSNTITMRDLSAAGLSTGEKESEGNNWSFNECVADMERQSLWKALGETGGNKSAAARLLGISERKIRYMLKKYGEESK